MPIYHVTGNCCCGGGCPLRFLVLDVIWHHASTITQTASMYNAGLESDWTVYNSMVMNHAYTRFKLLGLAFERANKTINTINMAFYGFFGGETGTFTVPGVIDKMEHTMLGMQQSQLDITNLYGTNAVMVIAIACNIFELDNAGNVWNMNAETYYGCTRGGWIDAL